MELLGDNPFKVRSYRTGADTAIDTVDPLASAVAAGGAGALLELRGVGKGIAAQIAEFVASGTSDSFERLREQVPESTLEILTVRGIGMRMAMTLHRDFGILDLEDLQRFAEGGGFEAVPGLGDKSIARLQSAIRGAVERTPSVPPDSAHSAAEAIREVVAQIHADAEVVIAGELRRGCERIRRIDLVVVADEDMAALDDALAADDAVVETIVATPDRLVVRTTASIAAHLRFARSDERIPAVVFATGTRRHVKQLQERAEERGFALTRKGLFQRREDASLERVALADEASLYERIGAVFVPPEGRDGVADLGAAV